MTALDTADSPAMNAEGSRIRARRERLSMGKRELAELAGVSRDTLAAIEAGEGFRRSSLTKIEHALDSLEEEAGYTAPPVEAEEAPRLPTFVIEDAAGLRIIVSGPIEDVDVLKRQVVDIVRAIRDRDTPEQGS